MGTGELCNLPGRTTNAAADIENLIPIFDANLGGEVVLVAGNGLVEPFAIGETAEVERLAPAVLVKVRCKIVVTKTCQT